MASNVDFENELSLIRKRIEQLEREQFFSNDRLVNWLYVLTSVVIALMVVLFVLVCNIYMQLGGLSEVVHL